MRICRRVLQLVEDAQCKMKSKDVMRKASTQGRYLILHIEMIYQMPSSLFIVANIPNILIAPVFIPTLRESCSESPLYESATSKLPLHLPLLGTFQPRHNPRTCRSCACGRENNDVMPPAISHRTSPAPHRMYRKRGKLLL